SLRASIRRMPPWRAASKSGSRPCPQSVAIQSMPRFRRPRTSNSAAVNYFSRTTVHDTVDRSCLRLLQPAKRGEATVLVQDLHFASQVMKHRSPNGDVEALRPERYFADIALNRTDPAAKPLGGPSQHGPAQIDQRDVQPRKQFTQFQREVPGAAADIEQRGRMG